MDMKTHKIISIIITIAVFTTMLLFIGCTANENFSEPVTNRNIKTVQLSSSDEGLYNPQKISVKEGTILRIEGDSNTLIGGMDTIIVDGYNVQKKISAQDNVLEFEANQKGEFLIHCANGMGNAKLIVE